MSAAKVGALVRYCGHEGTFIADIYKIGDVNVIRASGPVTMDNLNRDPIDYAGATHRLHDFPTAGFWRPDLGVFVVPEPQVVALTDTKIAANVLVGVGTQRRNKRLKGQKGQK